jgi:hypothetical protein
MPRPRPTTAVLAAIALLLALAALTLATGQAGAAKAWPGCKAFHSQPQAQARWIALGRPAGADGDHDGRVCEALPATATATATAPGTGDGACVKTTKVVDVGLNRDKYPHVLAHPRAAIAHGWPRVMVLNRRGADRRRDRLLAGIPTKAGFDRDEYPMAAGRGRGAAGLRRGRAAARPGSGGVAGGRAVRASRAEPRCRIRR